MTARRPSISLARSAKLVSSKDGCGRRYGTSLTALSLYPSSCQILCDCCINSMPRSAISPLSQPCRLEANMLLRLNRCDQRHRNCNIRAGHYMAMWMQGLIIGISECAGGDVLPKEAMDGLTMEYRAIANENPELAVSTVAIKVLTSVIERSKATTMMGLEKEIKEAASVLRRYVDFLPDIYGRPVGDMCVSVCACCSLTGTAPRRSPCKCMSRMACATGHYLLYFPLMRHCLSGNAQEEPTFHTFGSRMRVIPQVYNSHICCGERGFYHY